MKEFLTSIWGLLLFIIILHVMLYCIYLLVDCDKTIKNKFWSYVIGFISAILFFGYVLYISSLN